MKDTLKTGFADRLTTAAEAKKAQLAKFRPKPMAPDPAFEERLAARAAEKEAVRAERAAAKEAIRQAALASAEAIEAAKRGERKERKALSKVEAKAKRDARYAARKARN